jgi:hypothetical protein
VISPLTAQPQIDIIQAPGRECQPSGQDMRPGPASARNLVLPCWPASVLSACASIRKRLVPLGSNRVLTPLARVLASHLVGGEGPGWSRTYVLKWM